MISILVTVVVLVGIQIFVMFVSSRYWLKSVAEREFITAELSLAFRQHFEAELACCSVPYKRFVEASDKNSIRIDNRPIMHAAGELMINEELCWHLSPKSFLAGLEYEQAHIQRKYYLTTFIISAFILALGIPFLHLLNLAIKGFIVAYKIPVITGITQFIGWHINFFDTWTIGRIGCLYGFMAWSEFIVAHSIVKHLVYHGKFSVGLLEYLVYQESYVSPVTNQEFNITSNRKYLEKLLKRQEDFNEE